MKLEERRCKEGKLDGTDTRRAQPKPEIGYLTVGTVDVTREGKESRRGLSGKQRQASKPSSEARERARV